MNRKDDDEQIDNGALTCKLPAKAGERSVQEGRVGKSQGDEARYKTASDAIGRGLAGR